MNLGELKNIINVLPDDMPFALLDISTDEDHMCNYPLEEKDFEVLDYCEDVEEGNITGKALYLCFKNKMNDNPI